MGTRPLKERVLVVGASAFVEELAGLALEQGYAVTALPTEGEISPALQEALRAEGPAAAFGIEALPAPLTAKRALVEALDAALPPASPLLALCLITSATQVAAWTRHPERVVGFAVLPPIVRGGPVELAGPLQGRAEGVERARALLSAWGFEVAVVNDAVGLVLPRLLCALINEAAFAVMEGVAAPADIDTAMKLGTNYPRGPLEWADLIGLDLVVAILEALEAEHGGGLYRPAPLLRQMIRAGRLGRKAGRGFYP